jgi:hypothetical protein
LRQRRYRFPAALGGAAVAAISILYGWAAAKTLRAQQAVSDDVAIIRHLNAAITWYRQLGLANEAAGQPSDAFYLENARNLARQALQLAFQSAEAEASLLAAEKAGGTARAVPEEASPATTQQQNIAKSAASTAALVAQLQSQIASLDSQIANATGKRLQGLRAKRDYLQEQLDFNKALQEALQKLSAFLIGTSRKKQGLPEQIADLKKSVPDVFTSTPLKLAAPPAASSSAGSGLITQVSTLFAKVSDLSAIDRLMESGRMVSERAEEVRAPLRTRLRTTIDRGRGWANAPPPEDPAAVEATRQSMRSLTAQFKRISTATIPLAQEMILLDESQASLQQWKASAHLSYSQTLRSFLVRLGFLVVAIAIVMLISEAWRRATFRYAQEPRLRHQLLLLRTIITAALLAIVLALGFVSEFSSLATFAGFLAAGIAVAL